MNIPENLIALIEYCKKHLHFLDGLIVLLITSTIAYYTLTSLVGSHLINALSLINIELSKEYASFFFLNGLIGTWVIVVLIWFKNRTVKKFKKNEIGIIFAPHYPEDISKEVESLYNALQQEVRSHELGVRFSVKRLPPNISINGRNEAEDILRGCHGLVAIWGIMEQEESKTSTTGFSTINFTFVHRQVRVNIGSFASRLTVPLSEKKWKIDKKNLIVDQRIIAQDINLVVQNMIGLALYFNERYEDAVKVYLPLYNKLKAQVQESRSVPLRRFYNQIKNDCAMFIQQSVMDKYFKYLYGEGVYSIPQSLLKKWLANIEQAIKLDSQNSLLYIDKAILLFLLGDIIKAVTACKKAKTLAPKADASPLLSLAFLYHFKADYGNSNTLYRRALRLKTSYSAAIIKQSLHFIELTIEKYPEKKQFKYALGVLELSRGDSKLGCEMISHFLKDARGDDSLLKLVEEGEKLLSKYEKIES